MKKSLNGATRNLIQDIKRSFTIPPVYPYHSQVGFLLDSLYWAQVSKKLFKMVREWVSVYLDMKD